MQFLRRSFRWETRVGGVGEMSAVFEGYRSGRSIPLGIYNLNTCKDTLLNNQGKGENKVKPDYTELWLSLRVGYPPISNLLARDVSFVQSTAANTLRACKDFKE